MPFKKGKSGNPGGGSREVTLAWQDARRMARGKAHAAIDKLVRHMDDPDPKVSIAACKEILDRGLGKAVQAVEISEGPKDPLAMMTDDQLAQIAAVMSKLGKAMEADPALSAKLVEQLVPPETIDADAEEKSPKRKK